MRNGFPILSEKNIEGYRKYPNAQYWDIISEYDLSEDFIREFQDYVYWFGISYYQELSEEFMLEFKHKLDWTCLSFHKNLSKEFMIDNLDKISVKHLIKNKYISDEVKEFCRMFL